jgi:NADH-quinone oxidoreductase subunit A
MLGDWASLLIYLILAAAVPASLLAASLLLGVRGQRLGRQKFLPFESGVSRGDFQASNISVNYYLTAMLFIVFDIEIVFLYPLAVLIGQLGRFGIVELCVFVAVLAAGYVYIWRKGALQWR